jgi:hypothetical protein
LRDLVILEHKHDDVGTVEWYQFGDRMQHIVILSEWHITDAACSGISDTARKHDHNNHCTSTTVVVWWWCAFTAYTNQNQNKQSLLHCQRDHGIWSFVMKNCQHWLAATAHLLT